MAPVVYRRARTILGNDEEARDAMQEAFLRLARSNPTPPLLPWMYRVTTNLCLNQIRRRKSHPVALDPDAVRKLVDGVDDPERVSAQTVRALIAACDPLTQAIVVHLYFDGMSMEETASLVGRSRKTVGKRLARFKQRARDSLEEAR